MKRIFAIAVIVVVIAAMLCACGEKKTATNTVATQDSTGTVENVTVTVVSKYDDGFAETYASSTSTDENGNKVYEFTGPRYDEFVNDYKNNLSSDIQKLYVDKHEKGYGQYVYINPEQKAVIVGLNGKDEYDEKVAEEEAKAAAEYGFKFFQNLREPVDTIKVIYCNASDQSDIFGSFEFTASESAE